MSNTVVTGMRYASDTGEWDLTVRQMSDYMRYIDPVPDASVLPTDVRAALLKWLGADV